ncbi:MAG: 16S rRNA (guanine(966)-N(2))-methyltransferase RsmD [Paludibacter sp.]|jgi:16S rRNA (guanine(966)-N(2))-methyltransferase RsmD|nr:16S rRNA (guanine(966)-N(2))-methyltransferase RsmD [Paludibacter sp.]
MRIISGKFKSRRLEVPKNITARPTTDFAKESLFNLLNNRISFDDIDMLDLFAGTGSIGFEFISRGAKRVVSIELEDIQCRFIKKVCNELKIDNLTLIKANVFKFLLSCNTQYDVVFADAPYQTENIAEIPDLIFSRNLLKDEGLLVVEHSAAFDFSNHPHFSEHRNYGNVNFTFFE